MIKLSLAFLAGTVFATGIVICGGGRPAAMLALGFLLTVSIAAGVLWLTGVRRLARFLNAFMDGLEGVQQPVAMNAARNIRETLRPANGYRKPSTKQRDQILADTMEEYLTDDVFSPEKTEARRVQ
jgi:hypothetical protein